MKRLSLSLLLLLCAASVAIILIVRLALGPADLYEKDQPKTIAYTADMLLHGRWALPRDVIYQPATKPPLYNWIAAAVMKTSGSWGELAMKSPSVLGAIGVAAVLVLISWHGRLGRDEHGREGRATESVAIAALACAIWFSYGVDVRHGSVIRLLFLARPDMLQAFFVTAAWAAATVHFARMRRVVSADAEEEAGTPFRLLASERHSDRRGAGVEPANAPRAGLLLPAAFWLCLAGGILTKGPLALLLIVYAAVVARILAGSWRSIRALRPLAGLLVTTLLVGSWLFCAYRVDPHHVRHVMLGAEIAQRVALETPEGNAHPFWDSAMWFVTKGGIFSLLALAMLVVMAMRTQWPTPIDPVALGAAVWLLVLLVGLTLPAGKRIDYLLPTFAPAAYLAASLLVLACQHLRIPLVLAGLLPLWMSFTLARAHLTKFHESQEHWSDDAVAFARDVRSRVRDDEPLLVIVRGKHPLPTLLHRHQGSALDLAQLQAARWIVLPLIDTMAKPVTQSALLPLGFETIETRTRGVIGLFDMQSSEHPTMDELVAAQKRVATWTAKENPYFEPGTGWRE